MSYASFRREESPLPRHSVATFPSPPVSTSIGNPQTSIRGCDTARESHGSRGIGFLVRPGWRRAADKTRAAMPRYVS